jgi:hypothetical protein
VSRQTTARAVIVLVALAAHGLIVINNGILFDDWALVKVEPYPSALATDCPVTP